MASSHSHSGSISNIASIFILPLSASQTSFSSVPGNQATIIISTYHSARLVVPLDLRPSQLIRSTVPLHCLLPNKKTKKTKKNKQNVGIKIKHCRLSGRPGFVGSMKCHAATPDAMQNKCMPGGQSLLINDFLKSS